MATDYPGRLVKLGEHDARIVRAVKTALNRALALSRRPELRLNPANPSFGATTKRAVQLFQARHVDTKGRPLKVDGEIGAITWAVLFGPETVPSTVSAGDPLLARVLAIAAAEEAKAVREQPRNSNRGPEVDAYLRRAGVAPGYAWCCAFVYWCFDEAARSLALGNPMLRTAGCLNHWNGAVARGAVRLPTRDAVADPQRVRPGMVFIMDFGGGAGHTGLVESVQGGFATTLEGNTDASRTREGGGVYRLTRKLAEINKGFVDYAGLGVAIAPVRAPAVAPPANAARRVTTTKAKKATKTTTATTATTAKATPGGTKTASAKAVSRAAQAPTAAGRRRAPITIGG
ncbi:MAG: CHAP domain-containing protein [Rubrivivax sp.]